jgi:hypothetical protein
VKAERIRDEKEGDFTDNFNIFSELIALIAYIPIQVLTNNCVICVYLNFERALYRSQPSSP